MAFSAQGSGGFETPMQGAPGQENAIAEEELEEIQTEVCLFLYVFIGMDAYIYDVGTRLSVCRWRL